eukprot:1026000-Alexandrium_andersonii.AAC.1
MMGACTSGVRARAKLQLHSAVSDGPHADAWLCIGSHTCTDRPALAHTNTWTDTRRGTVRAEAKVEAEAEAHGRALTHAYAEARANAQTQRAHMHA